MGHMGGFEESLNSIWTQEVFGLAARARDAVVDDSKLTTLEADDVLTRN
jgi:hypothetical protein